MKYISIALLVLLSTPAFAVAPPVRINLLLAVDPAWSPADCASANVRRLDALLRRVPVSDRGVDVSVSDVTVDPTQREAVRAHLLARLWQPIGDGVVNRVGHRVRVSWKRPAPQPYVATTREWPHGGSNDRLSRIQSRLKDAEIFAGPVHLTVDFTPRASLSQCVIKTLAGLNYGGLFNQPETIIRVDDTKVPASARPIFRAMIREGFEEFNQRLPLDQRKLLSWHDERDPSCLTNLVY